jgi:phage FluMu protein Com
MAGVRIKFRCTQCNQLLGASPSRSGSVVTCPKCASDVVVPVPSEAPPPPAAEAEAAGMVPPPAPEGGPWVPRELLDIRPEDIRVELGIDLDRPLAPPPPPPTPSGVSLRSEPEPPPLVFPPTSDLADDSPVATPFTAPAPTEPAPAPVVPPIKIEPETIAEVRATSPGRPRDVVLPRSVVATWSLLVLLAQALAFVAGLLAGHFVWKVH